MNNNENVFPIFIVGLYNTQNTHLYQQKMEPEQIVSKCYALKRCFHTTNDKKQLFPIHVRRQ